MTPQHKGRFFLGVASVLCFQGGVYILDHVPPPQSGVDPTLALSAIALGVIIGAMGALCIAAGLTRWD